VEHRTAVRAAWFACALGLAYAAVSVYWALGGAALLDTLGGALEREARSGSFTSQVLAWSAAILKLVGAALPVAVVQIVDWSRGRSWLRVLCWTEAVLLTVYGLVLTTAGLAVQSGLVSTSAHADRRALAWHAFLWDPWFLAWGSLVTFALLAARETPKPRNTRACSA
jgi:hypothetical protein